MSLRRGYLLVLVAAFCFGTMPVLAKGAYAEGVNVPTLLLQRFGFAAVLLWMLLLVRKEALPRGKPLALLVCMGGVVYFGQAFTFFLALKYVSVALASFLAFLYPVIVSLFSHLFLTERLTPGRAGALGIAVAGTFLAVGPIDGGDATGVPLALLSAVGTAAYILLSARVPKSVSPLAAEAVVMGGAGLSFLLFAWVQGLSHVTPKEIGWGAGLALATLIGLAGVHGGVKVIGAVRTSSLLALQPVTAAALAYAFLHQPPTTMEAFGGLLTVAGVLLVTRKAK